MRLRLIALKPKRQKCLENKNDSVANAGHMLSPAKISSEKPDQGIFFNPGNTEQSSAGAVKTPGGGFVLTRYITAFLSVAVKKRKGAEFLQPPCKYWLFNSSESRA